MKSKADTQAWKGLLASIDSGIASLGYWSGEACVVRDAAGYHRLRVRVWEDIVRRLTAAGYDVESEFGGIPYESFYVMVRVRGWAEWQEAGEALLDEYVKASLEVPKNATWYDHSVRSLAVGRWARTQARSGRTLMRLGT